MSISKIQSVSIQSKLRQLEASLNIANSMSEQIKMQLANDNLVTDLELDIFEVIDSSLAGVRIMVSKKLTEITAINSASN